MSLFDSTTGNDDNDGETSLRKTLASLDVQRQSIESEADAIISELTTSDGNIPSMGIDTPLVDQDGYPRNDIDVYRARTLRHRLATLKTDHKAIVGEIEKLLVELAKIKKPSKQQEEEREKKLREQPKPLPKYDRLTGRWVVANWDGTTAGVKGGDQIPFHDLSRSISDVTNPTISTVDPSSVRTISGGTNTSANELLQPTNETIQQTTTTPLEQQQQQPVPRPFARIDAVAPDSPAHSAGLMVEDLIVGFGYVNADNHHNLKAIAALVPDVAAEHGDIKISVLRKPTIAREDVDDGEGEDDGRGAPRELVVVSLQPRPWDGRGLIGCHIVPYHDI